MISMLFIQPFVFRTVVYKQLTERLNRHIHLSTPSQHVSLIGIVLIGVSSSFRQIFLNTLSQLYNSR